MSATVVVRKVVSTPARSASETWAKIVDLVSRGGSVPAELAAAGGVASSLISTEVPADSPLVMFGVGPQLRIYCLYGEAAILQEGVAEDSLAWNPTDGDWHLSLPASKEDVPWAGVAVAKAGKRITVRDSDESVVYEESEEETAEAAMTPNPQGFLRP